MPRLTRSLPRYRRHKPSGQAVVTLNGKDHYVGRHNSRISRISYDRLVSEWLASGRRLPAAEDPVLTIEEIARARHTALLCTAGLAAHAERGRQAGSCST